MTGKKNVLEADSIVVYYGQRTVLNNVYIRVEQGEVVGLLGRNGCGKSTLLKSIFGVIEPSHKTIRINGVWMKSGHIGSRVTMLPQADMIPHNISLRKALQLFAVDEARIADSVPALISLLDHSPSQLSGGERRVFELMLILYSRSQFCLLDEPFTGLAPVMVEKMIGLMNEVKRTKGILVTDHLHRSVTSCSDRLYIFNEGRLDEAYVA
jgi:ABC-type multidrug transport system ATPase subunit